LAHCNAKKADGSQCTICCKDYLPQPYCDQCIDQECS
jgi:hypothetical protein